MNYTHNPNDGKKGNRILIFSICLALYLIIAMLTSSCRSVQQNVTEKKEETKKEVIDTSKTKTEIVLKENVKEETKVVETDESTITETTFTPIDESKPSSVTTPEGKKHDFINTTITVKQTKAKIKTESDKNILKEKSSETNAVEQKGLSERTENKKTDKHTIIKKEPFKTPCWWWVLFFIICYIVWRLWKNKWKIAGIFTGTWWL